MITVLFLAGLACSLTPGDLTDPGSLATLVSETMEAAGENASTIATSVAETLQAGELLPLPQETGDQQDSQTPPEDLYQTGTVNGLVCYPSEFTPDMMLYLENRESKEITAIPIPKNQPVFSAPVPPGFYVAYAWLRDYSGGGLYSEAVPCGLNVNCTDHTLIEFEVATGEEVNDIQVCDWYISPSEIPYPPGINYNQIHGSISGKLGYPSEIIPAMTIVATNQTTNQFYFVETILNDSVYKIEHLPPGSYQVVAYLLGEDISGGYSEFVPCGLSVDCSDHSLITFQVTAGQETAGIDPLDFYAPPGTFPPNPTN
jgi:hypothetical protein